MAEILMVNDIIEYLKVDKMTVYKMIHEGRIRAYNLGSVSRPMYRIKRDEFEEDLKKMSNN